MRNKENQGKNIFIRQGTADDLPRVMELVRELAEYEKAPHEVENSVELMMKDGFGKNPLFGFLVAEYNDTIAGISLYYFRYSTWKGKMLYLEDLIVTENFRKLGIGKRLFEGTIEVARKTESRGMIWQVLEWNKPAFDFYDRYKPIVDPQWVTCRLSKEQIEQFTPN
jgi:GNAT superfamily N-acetyltransferase